MTIYDNNKKSDLGQIFTPPDIASLMAKLLIQFNPHKIVDPAVGEGALLKAVKTYSNSEILGYDIDKEWVLKLKNEGFNVKVKDFFDSTSTYDGIIMNPPYIRQEKLNNRNFPYLNKDVISRKLDYPNIPKKANLYIYFTWKALLSMKDEKSVLVAIMPNTWLTSTYGKSLQKLILDYYSIDCIINFDENVFEGFDVDVSIIVIKNYHVENNILSIFDVKGELTKKKVDSILSNTLLDKGIKLHQVTQSNLKPFKWFDYRGYIEFNYNNLVEVQEKLEVTRGVTTNYNEFFIRNKDENLVKKNEDYFYPILNKAQEVKGFSIKLFDLDKRILHTNNFKRELPESLRVEIERLEESLITTSKPKTLYSKYEKNPSTWYMNSRLIKKSIVLNYIIRSDVRFILNDNISLIKDNFYEMVPYEKNDYDYYIAVLNSTFTKYFLEKNGRSYGTGLLKVQKYQLDNLPILDIKKIDKESMIEIKKLGQDLLLGKDKKRIIKKIDNELSKYYLINPELVNEFYIRYNEIIVSRRGTLND
jgi:hypothetical protein